MEQSPFPVSGKLLEACVLGVASRGDTYGYDLTQQVSKVVEISETALYPVLRRLLKEEYFTTYDKPHQGRNRKYYKITEKGKMQLESYLSHWESYQWGISGLLQGGIDHE